MDNNRSLAHDCYRRREFIKFLAWCFQSGVIEKIAARVGFGLLESSFSRKMLNEVRKRVSAVSSSPTKKKREITKGRVGGGDVVAEFLVWKDTVEHTFMITSVRMVRKYAQTPRSVRQDVWPLRTSRQIWKQYQESDQARIQAMNPGLTLPQDPIVWVDSKVDDEVTLRLTTRLSKISPQFKATIGITNKTTFPINNTVVVDLNIQKETGVITTRGGFSAVGYHIGIQVNLLGLENGLIPTNHSLQSCFNENSERKDPRPDDCYPFSEAWFFVTYQNYYGVEQCSYGNTTAEFMRYFVTNKSIMASYGFSPINGMLSDRALNMIYNMTCDGVSMLRPPADQPDGTSTQYHLPVWAVIVLCVALVVGAGVLGGFVWFGIKSKNQIIQESDVQMLGELGRGNFGVTYRARRHLSQQEHSAL
eukprot:jgi/Bigna1/66571/fgenesh1_pg.1_\